VKFSTLAFAAVMAITATSASATSIINGGFDNNLTGWTTSGKIDVATAGVYVGCCGASGTLAQMASKRAFFGDGDFIGTNTLTQSFATTIGRTYDFSFDSATFGGGPQQVSYNIGGQTGTTNLTAANFAGLRTFTGSFVASATTSTASFFNTTGPDSVDASVDNVSVVASVPEPATWGMMIVGFGMVGVATRRRKAAVAA
jgi:hypothetical protein